jgi:hypothetical protein
MYKTQLIAGRTQTISRDPEFRHQGASVEARWSIFRVQESAPQPGRYDLELEFPEFAAGAGDLDELNTVLRANALKQMHKYRTRMYWDRSNAEPDWIQDIRDVCVGSFEICLLTADFVSIKHSLYEYNAGAAHGNITFLSENYRRKPLTQLDLSDMFCVTAEMLAVMSTQCAHALSIALPDGDPDWIRQGLAPELRNFETANVSANGLLITIPAGQVSCYADGPQTVLLSKELLRPFLRPHVLDAVWKDS